jgi:hypothetical protein
MTATEMSSLQERLAELATDDCRIISCYLMLDPIRRNDLSYPIQLKDLARDAQEDLESSGASREVCYAISADLDRLRDLVATTSLPHAPAMAVFACSALDLFEVVPLPWLSRESLTIGRRPDLMGLLAADRYDRPVLLIAADRTLARTFLIGPFRAWEIGDLTAWAFRGGRFHSDRATPRALEKEDSMASGRSDGVGMLPPSGGGQEKWHSVRVFSR